jgi:type II secretory pathway component PulC
VSWLRGRYGVQADPLRTERRVEAVALIVVVLLLLQVLWGLYRLASPATLEPVVPSADSLEVAPLAGVLPVTPEESEAIRLRPLFWVSRRPEALADASEASSSQSSSKDAAKGLDGIKLAGVFGAGSDAGIIVMNNKGKKQRLTVGQSLNGWRLDAVESTRVTLTSAGREAQLSLERGDPLPRKAPDPVTESGPKAGKPAKSARSGKKQKKSKTSAESSQETPPGLGLGGGDRNRGTTKQ